MLLLSNRRCRNATADARSHGGARSAYRELALGRVANAQRSDAVTTTARSDAVYSLKPWAACLPSAGVGVVRLNSDIISFGERRQVKLPPTRRSLHGLGVAFQTHDGGAARDLSRRRAQRMCVGAASALGCEDLARADVSTVGLIWAQAGRWARRSWRSPSCRQGRAHSLLQSHARKTRSVLCRASDKTGAIDPGRIHAGGRSARCRHRPVRHQLDRCGVPGALARARDARRHHSRPRACAGGGGGGCYLVAIHDRSGAGDTSLQRATS